MRLGQTSIITFLSRFGSSAIGFLATLYFAKVLGSDVLGLYFLTLATVAWLKLGCNFGIPLAVTKRVSEGSERDSHIVAGLVLAMVGFFIFSIALFALQEHVNRYLGRDLYQLVILLLGAQILYSFVGAVLKGEHLVHVEGMLNVTQTIFRAVLQVLAVSAGYGIVGMLFGEATAFIGISVFGVLLMIWYFNRSLPLRIPTQDHFKSIFKFAKYSVLGSVKGRSFNLMDTIVLGFFVSTGLIGIYGICWNISSVLSIFSKSVTSSFFPEMSKLSANDNQERVASYLTDTIAFAGLLIIPGFVGAVVIGEGVLNIYGSEFRKGYTVLIILVAAILVHSYHIQFVNTMDAIDRPALSFRVNGFFVVTNVIMNFVLVSVYGWVGAAVATLLSVFASLLLAYRIITELLDFNIPYREMSYQFISAIVMGILVRTGMTVFRMLGVNVYRTVPTMALVVFGATAYFACLLVISSRFRTIVSTNLPEGYMFDTGDEGL